MGDRGPRATWMCSARRGLMRRGSAKGSSMRAAMAVDEASGDVYVAEPLRGRGAGVRARRQWWVSPARRNGRGRASRARDSAKSRAWRSITPKVASAGDVYVVEAKAVGARRRRRGRVQAEAQSRTPEEVREGEGEEGEFVTRLSGPKLEEPNGVAVSPRTGRVLVADSVKGAVYAYSAEGRLRRKADGQGLAAGVVWQQAKKQKATWPAWRSMKRRGICYVAEAERACRLAVQPEWGMGRVGSRARRRGTWANRAGWR